MVNSTAKEEPFSIIAGTDQELDLLIRYHFFIAGQVGQMAIHPLFKQDIKNVLTSSIAAVIAHAGDVEKPKRISTCSRIYQRLSGRPWKKQKT